MATKRKPVAGKRDHYIMLRLTDAEVTAIAAHAKKKGCAPAVWVRMEVLERLRRNY